MNNVFRKFLMNVSWLFFLEIFLKIKGIVLIPLITKNLGAINYGVWSQVTVLITTIYPIVVLGTDSAIIRFLPGQPLNEKKKDFLSWMLFLFSTSLVGCFFICVTFRFWGVLYFGMIDSLIIQLIFLAAFNIVVSMMINAIKIWFRILNDAKAYAVFLALQGLLNLLAIVFALINEGSVYDIVLYTLITDIVLVGGYICKFASWSNVEFNINLYKRLLKYGYCLIPSAYAMWEINSADRIFLAQYASLKEIGIYSLAYSIGYLPIQLLVNPIWTMFPNQASELFNQGKIKELNYIEKCSRRLIVLFTEASVIFFYFSGKDIISIISTSEFSSGYIAIPFIIIAYTFHILASYIIIKLGLVGKQKYDGISMIVACSSNLILNYLLIPIYGFVGAAIATSIAFGIQFIVVSLVANERLFFSDFEFKWQSLLLLGCVFLFLMGINNFFHYTAIFNVMLNFSFISIAYGCFIWLLKSKFLLKI